MKLLLHIIIAMTACFSTTATANLNHATNMNEDTKVVAEPSKEIKLSEKDIARFWSKVDKNGPLPDQSNPHYAGLGPCWTFLGQGRNSAGYGTFGAKGKAFLVHRLSYRLQFGDIPQGVGHHGMCVLHKCDNRICVNGAHLSLGTQKQNEEDKCLKGRQAKGDRSGSRIHRDRMARGTRNGAYTKPECVLRGEKVGNSKLTEVQVREILTLAGSHASISRSYGVSETNIRDIKKRKTWKHLDAHG